jgi:lysophospholipase L1-like esterase
MKILCYGDSNTFGHDPSNKGNHKHPWPTLILNHDIINHGVNGRTLTIQPTENRFPSAVETIDQELVNKYDLIIIMIGTNDLKYRYHVNDIIFKSAYTFIINKIQEKYPNQKIILLPLANILVNNNEWENAIEKRDTFNKIIEDISLEFSIDYFDYGLLEISQDNIHLTQIGHQQLAARINQYLIKKVSEDT